MRRLFKYTWRLLVVLLVLLLATYFIVLHTQFGARWTINYFTQQMPLTIKSIEGTLANKIKLNDINYDDKSTALKAKQLSYQIKQIDWFSRKLVFDAINIQKLELEFSESSTGNPSTPAFDGLNLPLELEVRALKVDEILIKTKQTIEQLNQINLAILAKNQSVNVSELSIGHKNFLVEGSGSLQLKSNMPFDLSTNWSAFNDVLAISGLGQISGDLTQMKVNQAIKINKGMVIGDLKLDAELDFNKDVPALNVSLASAQLVFDYPDQNPINLESFTGQVMGSVDNYEITSNFILFNEDIEKTTMNLNGLGNLESIDLNELNLKNSQGTIKLPTVLNWKDEISAVSQVELIDFNPAAYLPEWPGVLNGTTSLSSSLLDNGDYLISVENALFNGTLKQKEFFVKANVKINPLDIIVNQTQLIMGDNTVDINAIIKDTKIEADFKAVLNDLSVLNKNAQGTVISNFKVKGDFKNPEIIGQANVKNAKYQDYHISSLDINVKGDWLNHISIQTIAQGIDIEDKLFDSIKLNVNGNKNKHDINFKIEDETMASEISANGSLNETTNEWIGNILQNNIELKDIQSTWKLKEPVTIAYKKDINLTRACWINQESSGDVCLDFAISPENNNHQINLDLNKFDVRFLEIFLPQNLIVNGKLQGNAKIHLTEDNVSIESAVELLDGEIQFLKDSKEIYQSKILKATLVAKQDNNISKFNSNVSLNDGTELNFDFDLFKDTNDKIEIKGNIDGMFANTEYLASLSDEIEEMSGDFNIKGSVQGPLDHLKTNFKAHQNQGYLILSQSKTKLENLTFELQKHPDEDIGFKLIGNAGKGQLTGTGSLSIDNKNTGFLWQLNANIKGDNMRLLTLPELELDITPDLKIKANNKGALISGDINIPYAIININQLPDSAVNSSPDVIIHSNKDAIEELDDYPINFDVSAHIDDKIKVDVLGLKSDLQGSLRVTNTENSIIYGYGSLKLIDGKYSIYGQTLDISKGELIFNGPIDNPSLDVIASRKSISGDVTAGVELGGTVNYLQSSLYSDPLLTDLEILSYILSGRGLNEDNDTSTQQLAQAAILLGLKKSSPIFSEIQSKLGIDVLTIKEGATAKDSIVEAGKQFNEKLYVGYNQGLFNRIGFWVLRYRINKALRLETTQGETQSVDLIYIRKKK